MAEVVDASSSPRQFRIAVYALIFNSEHEILLALRRDIDWWNLPGGGLELEETVEEGVCREVREETGLEVEVDHLVGVYSKPQKQELVLTFLCRTLGGTLTTTDESRECRYFAPEGMPVNTLPKHRQRVMDVLRNEKHAVLRTQRSTSEEDQRLPPT